MGKYYLPVFSGLLLGLSFLHPSFGLLIYIAFSPLLYRAMHSNISQIYLASLVTGILAFLVANHWIYSFSFNLTASYWQSIAILSLYTLYSAHGISIFCVGVLILYKKLSPLALTILVPLFGTAIFSSFPFLFDFSLAATQTGSPTMLFPIHLSGQWGLTFLILLINTLVSFLISAVCGKRRLSIMLYTAAIFFCLGVWLVIGINQAKAPSQPQHTVTIGFHQPNDPPEIQHLSARGSFSLAYTEEIKNTYLLSHIGAKIVVWPESRPKGLLSLEWVMRSYAAHAQAMGIHIITQDIGGKNSEKFNSSIHLTPDGNIQIYNKVKRIPFGEYMPTWLASTPFHGVVSSLFRDINKEIVAGTHHTVFPLSEISALPLICYEILDSIAVSKAVSTMPNINLILLQSNDAWFLSQHQARMHNNFAILRSVETQRPVLHITNMGPSYFINRSGDIVWQSSHGVAGSFISQITVPSTPIETSLAVRYPGWFLQLSALFSLLTFAYILVRSTLNRTP